MIKATRRTTITLTLDESEAVDLYHILSDCRNNAGELIATAILGELPHNPPKKPKHLAVHDEPMTVAVEACRNG